MTTTHYVLGSWPMAESACGLRGLAHRPVSITRDPSHVSCRKCRAAMLRMARRTQDWPRLANL